MSGLTKNDHFRRMLEAAEGRGFQPRWVLFDSWYTSLENLKAIRDKGWFWLSQLRSNRRVNPEGGGNSPLATVAIPQEGRQVHLRGYGFIRVFRTVSKDGDVEHWATNDLEMTEQQRESLARQAWGIETYHRGLKPGESPQTSGPQTSGPQTSGPQTSGPQTSGPQTSGPQTSGPQTSGPQTSGPQTMLWRGEMPSAYGGGTAESHPPVPPSLPAAGSPPLERRSLLVRVQSRHHPLGLTRLPGLSQVHSPSNCVTPNTDERALLGNADLLSSSQKCRSHRGFSSGAAASVPADLYLAISWFGTPAGPTHSRFHADGQLTGRSPGHGGRQCPGDALAYWPCTVISEGPSPTPPLTTVT